MMKGKYFNCSEEEKTTQRNFCNKILLLCVCPFNNSKIESADSFEKTTENFTKKSLIRNTVCDVFKAYYLFGES